jgi:phosphotransferase system enzyme I (PtsI)
MGPVHFIREEDASDSAAGTPEFELERFKDGLAACSEQLHSIETDVAAADGKDLALIFEAQRLFLEDPLFLDEVRRHISREGVKTEQALHLALQKVREDFSSPGDEYIAGRIDDLLDVVKRLESCLSGRQPSLLEDLKEPSVVISSDFLPSQIAQMDSGKILGLVSEKGSRTSHAAILLRARGIPAVFGAAGIMSHQGGAEYAIVDGKSGLAILDPDGNKVREYRSRPDHEISHAPSSVPGGGLIMKDGRKITLLANAGSLDEARLALEEGAEGIGLLRSEQLFLLSRSLPGEEAQAEFYASILALFAPRPVTIRTLDIGGDKTPAYMELPREENPSLGLRGIRYSLREKSIFRTQLRAMIKASRSGRARVMLPMVSSLQEIRAAVELLGESAEECGLERAEVSSMLPLGIMVEIPSAAITAESLLSAVDFISIGSNDLAQYTLAADRGGVLCGSDRTHYHPAVLRLIRMTVEAAVKAGKNVSLCGEMASDPAAAVLLAGLGLTILSVNPPSMAAVRRTISAFDMEEASALAERALCLPGITEVELLISEHPILGRA